MISKNHDATAMSKCTVQLWYNKQRPKKNGTVSLYIQLIVDKEHDEIPIRNLEWPLACIDWKKKTLLPRWDDDADILEYNAMIEEERSRYWNVIKSFLLQRVSFGLTDIYKKVNLFSQGDSFTKFMEYAIRERQTTKRLRFRIKQSTAKAHTSNLKQLETYLGGNDVEVIKINADWLERYADHLRQSIQESTVGWRIKNLKAYIHYAELQGIPVDPNYKLFNVRVDESDPTWLEEHELQSLIKLYQQSDLSVKNRRNLLAFLFNCFTGLRISDLKRWNKDWVVNNYISFIPQKTRASILHPKPVVIPIIPIAQAFINDLKGETFDLPEDQVYNRELKDLAVKAGIPKNLTAHVARHTFATWLAMDGVPVKVISKLLGHKKEITTMIYIHIAENYKAEQMMKLQTRFGAKVLTAGAA